MGLNVKIHQGRVRGISMIRNKYAEANIPYMTNYDQNLPNSYITYLHANYLYGWAMS